MKVVGTRMRLTDWGRQFGLSTRASWQMYRDGPLPEGLVVEKVGKLLYVRVPDEEREDDLARDVTEVLTSLCARLYGRRSAASRARRALAVAGEGVS